MRPARLVLVAGTGTEVGKTWVGERLLAQWRDWGLAVAARKPAQSFGVEGGQTDADRLAGASGEVPMSVCPASRWYPLPMAPPMAAVALGRPLVWLADLVAEVDGSWPDRAVEVGLVEAAGGVAAPQAEDGDTVALARALGADVVVLVADAGLGTINAVRLAVGALAAWPVVVYLNRFDADVDLHERNRAWLADRDGYWVVTDLPELAQSAAGRSPL